LTIDRRAVLDFLSREAHRPLSLAELSEALGLAPRERPALQAVLRGLVRAGDVARIRGGRFGLPNKMNLVVGDLRCTPRGFGFVVPAKGGIDVFVRQPNMGGALHGDRVVARIEHKKPDGRLEGAVVRVLERANRRILGKFEAGPGYARVIPIEPKILTEIIIAESAEAGAEDGEVVEVEIIEYAGRTREASGRIVDRLGSLDDPAVDLELVLRQHELPRGFSADVRALAASVPPLPDPGEIRKRTDFRDDPVVTIDGEKARDFDDAVSVEALGNGRHRLQVHIADVSHYVTDGSLLDQEARDRATSVYFPDHVIPMLPEELSNGICSLNPAVERLTLSLVMEVDGEGEVKDYRFHRGVIRSRERMTYTAVHRILVDRDPELSARYHDLVPMFRRMGDLAGILMEKRHRRGSIDFDLPESEIVLDLAGEMTGIRRGERLLAHRIIEEFMILANETVATHLASAALAAIYRIHEPPDPGDVEELNRSLALLGQKVTGDAPKSFRHAIEKTRGKPEERLVQTLVLRTMKLARYDTENIGHFGLASTAYTHFTSPIRRYPDLVVHRLIKAAMSGGAGGGRGARDERDQLGGLERTALECSRLERRAEEGEREYIERKKARFMADKVGERFAGVITAVESFGFFGVLEEYFVDGLVHLTSLHDDYYQYDEDAHRLTGEHTARTFRLGDRIEVEVRHVDLLRRRVDFGLPRERGTNAAKPPARTAPAPPKARPPRARRAKSR
jgi:ribonuclease R